MYSKPGEGLSSAHQKKVEHSFRTRQSLTTDHLSPKARKAVAAAKAKKEAEKATAELRAEQERARRNTAAAMARIASASKVPDPTAPVEADVAMARDLEESCPQPE